MVSSKYDIVFNVFQRDYIWKGIDWLSDFLNTQI